HRGHASLGGCRERLGMTPHADDSRAVVREPDREGAADASAGARDDDDSPVEGGAHSAHAPSRLTARSVPASSTHRARLGVPSNAFGNTLVSPVAIRIAMERRGDSGRADETI